jgi:hypothetical protein
MQTHMQNYQGDNRVTIASSMQECIQNCTNCYQICSSLILHCLQKGGAHAEVEHIRLLEDCARICNLSADFMIRHSQFHSKTCEVCSVICTGCAKNCESMADDPLMATCAAICHKCADSCKEMSKMH